jgi:hypothetical protein
LSFNIGNLYYRIGKYGEAVAYLERARALAPGSHEIRTALDLSTRSLLSQMGTRDLDPAAAWYERMDQHFPLPALGAVFAVVCCISLWNSRGRRTQPSFWAAITFGLLATSAAALGYLSSLSHSAVAIEASMIRSGPGETYLELSRLDAGLKVRDVDDSASADWASVRYDGGKTGWVKKSTLLLLD